MKKAEDIIYDNIHDNKLINKIAAIIAEFIEMAENGKMPDLNILDNIKKIYPKIYKKYIKNTKLVMAIKEAVIINSLINKYNEFINELLINCPGYGELNLTIEKLNKYSDKNKDPEHLIFKNDLFYIEIVNILYLPKVDINLINIDQKFFWSVGLEQVSTYFELLDLMIKNEDIHQGLILQTQSQTIEKLYEKCKFLSTNFLVGYDYPDFEYILNSTEFHCILEKQKNALKYHIKDIIKESYFFYNYLVALCEINHLKKFD